MPNRVLIDGNAPSATRLDRGWYVARKTRQEPNGPYNSGDAVGQAKPAGFKVFVNWASEKKATSSWPTVPRGFTKRGERSA
jgi:hypothetical protein